jgi:biopolymer transport protein ExbD
MARKRNLDTGQDPGLNMTPMIDCVFQLIIFFMICSRICDAEIEVVVLPDASEAQADKNPEKKRLTVNIMAPNKNGDCEIRVKGKLMDLKRLYRFLKTEAALDRDKKDERLSNRPLLIRSSKDAPFKYTQAVMQECVKPGVGIWKIQIACAEAKAGGPALR